MMNGTERERTGARSASTEAMCTCGHLHRREARCGAVVSGSPNLTHCECPGLVIPGEHLRGVRPAD